MRWFCGLYTRPTRTIHTAVMDYTQHHYLKKELQMFGSVNFNVYFCTSNCCIMKQYMILLRGFFLLIALLVGYQSLLATTYKLTQVTAVADGNKYVFVESGHALTTVSSSAIQSTTSYNTTGLAGTESYVWTLESGTGGYYVKMSDEKYLVSKNNSADMKTESWKGNGSVWAISFSESVALISVPSNENRFIGNTTNNTYKAYAASNLDSYAHDFVVYLLEEETSSTPTPADTYTVTYHVGDNEYHVDRTEGAVLGLESPDAIGGMDFAGWSSSSNTSSPVWVPNTTSVTSDMELYAMFTMAVGIAPSYVLVESDLSDWRGDYLIASSATTFADGKIGGTGSGGIGYSGHRINPGDNLNGKEVDVAWGDTHHVTLEAVDDENLAKGYLMKTQDGKYNYCTSGSDLSTSSDAVVAASHALTITFNSSSNIVISAHNKSFRYNSGTFRFYASNTGSAVYLYKKVEEMAVYSLAKSHPVTITTAKYATYCSDEGLDFSTTGVTVYKAKVSDGVVRLTEVEGGVVPAGVGVLLYKDVNVDELVNVPVKTTSDEITDNELVGLLEKTVVPWTSDDKYNYILQKDGDGQAKFFKATGAKLAGNRAYLHTAYDAATTAHALEIDMDNKQTTAVRQIERSDENVGNYYNLNGQRIAQPQKGINVVNGHKVVVR